MKKQTLFGALTLLLCALQGCAQEQEGERITGKQEYNLTVASRKLPGIVSSCGSNFSTEVFAVKKDNSTEWESLAYIKDFDYEEGYEYKIRIRQTNYLDYRRGEPAWTEYEFLELLSKQAKESDDLPDNFIPDWFVE